VKWRHLITDARLVNWPLAILGGIALAYFYTLINSSLKIYSHILVQQYPNITSGEGKLYLLYLGHFLTGSFAATLAAFPIGYILGVFFRGSPLKFGVITGIVGIPLLMFITEPFSGIFVRQPGFFVC